MKIIFRIIVGILAAYIMFDMVRSFCKSREGPSEENEDNDEDLVSYELVDDISALRERSKNIEDLISMVEISDEDISGVKVSFEDASGRHHFSAEANEELLRYLYTERHRIKKEITRKMRTF